MARGTIPPGFAKQQFKSKGGPATSKNATSKVPAVTPFTPKTAASPRAADRFNSIPGMKSR
jgi:hypothetical protein